MLFDYETLKLIWWLLLGLLIIGFAIMDGHDIGVCSLLPFVGKSDAERRVIINTIGPHWEGNQVWFISAGGVAFAAFPLVYATAFSSLYWALMAALWAMFLRPVGFKYRSLIKDPRWRQAWDWGLFVGSFVPALIFGIAFGNLFLGIDFVFDDRLVSTYTGVIFWIVVLVCAFVWACECHYAHHARRHLSCAPHHRCHSGAHHAPNPIDCLGTHHVVYTRRSVDHPARWLCDHQRHRWQCYHRSYRQDRDRTTRGVAS